MMCCVLALRSAAHCTRSSNVGHPNVPTCKLESAVILERGFAPVAPRAATVVSLMTRFHARTYEPQSGCAVLCRSLACGRRCALSPPGSSGLQRLSARGPQADRSPATPTPSARRPGHFRGRHPASADISSTAPRRPETDADVEATARPLSGATALNRSNVLCSSFGLLSGRSPHHYPRRSAPELLAAAALPRIIT